MTAEVSETEKKYELGPATVLPSMVGLPQVAAESELAGQKLEAEYYDTAGLHLIRAGLTLRRRRGGSDAGWHLKLPAGADTRREIQLPLGRTGRRVPAELAALARAQSRAEPLQPVALITTIRQRRVLLDAAGTSLAELMTDEVTAQAIGEAVIVTQWREAELELTGGDLSLLRAADKRLRGSGLRAAGHAAKLERALESRLTGQGKAGAGAAGSATARPGKAGKLHGDSAAAELTAAYGQAQVAALTAADPLVRRDEPGSVHDMRVATRRLRATLKTFGPPLGWPQADSLRAELKWLGDVLGEARDIEVLADRLQAQVARLPAVLPVAPAQAEVSAYFAPRAASARQVLLAALNSGRYIELLNRLDQLFSGPPPEPVPPPAHQAIRPALHHVRRRVRKRARRADRSPAGPDRETALHQVRKATKDARYAAELARPAGRGKPRRMTRQMKGLQALLGDHHDAVVARDTARAIGMRAHQAGQDAFVFGVLYAVLDREARRLEKRAVKQLAQNG